MYTHIYIYIYDGAGGQQPQLGSAGASLRQYGEGT